jgi:hypothetical protein
MRIAVLKPLHTLEYAPAGPTLTGSDVENEEWGRYAVQFLRQPCRRTGVKGPVLSLARFRSRFLKLAALAEVGQLSLDAALSGPPH